MKSSILKILSMWEFHLLITNLYLLILFGSKFKIKIESKFEIIVIYWLQFTFVQIVRLKILLENVWNFVWYDDILLFLGCPPSIVRLPFIDYNLHLCSLSKSFTTNSVRKYKCFEALCPLCLDSFITNNSLITENSVSRKERVCLRLCAIVSQIVIHSILKFIDTGSSIQTGKKYDDTVALWDFIETCTWS